MHDTFRRIWIPKGKGPIVAVTGSHRKTCVFGALPMDGKQFFRQYDVFNQSLFLKYQQSTTVHRTAAQHHSSIIIRKHLIMIIEFVCLFETKARLL